MFMKRKNNYPNNELVSSARACANLQTNWWNINNILVMTILKSEAVSLSANWNYSSVWETGKLLFVKIGGVLDLLLVCGTRDWSRSPLEPCFCSGCNLFVHTDVIVTLHYDSSAPHCVTLESSLPQSRCIYYCAALNIRLSHRYSVPVERSVRGQCFGLTIPT